MPTIKKNTKGKYNPNRERNDLDRKKRQKIYQNPLWKRFRDAHLREHPLCQICELEGRVTLAEHAHHLRTFTEGRTDIEMKTLAFDPRNLASVCPLCHWEIHHGRFKGCKSLDEVKQRIEARK